MKLSEDQIKELYLFTRKHFVKHYDLQTELVDHLANGIEHKLIEHPKMAFKEALQEEFAKFGVFGFHDVIKDRRRAMAKKYRTFIIRNFKAYFRLPKISKLIAMTLAFFLLLQLVDPEHKFFAITIFTILVGGAFLWYSHKNRSKYQSKNGTQQKRWLMEEMIANIGDAGIIVIAPFYLFNSFAIGNTQLENFYLELVICLFITCYLTLSYVMVFVVPKIAEELLSETYPEYKLK